MSQSPVPESPVPESPVPESPVPRKSRRVLRWLVELTLLVGVLLAIGAWRGRDLIATSQPAVPFTLPRVDMNAADADLVSLQRLAGKKVLLHFWATWCGVCRQEFAALNAVQAGLAADEVLISIVDDSEDLVSLQRFVAEHGITYPVLVGDAALRRAYGVSAFPTNYFIGSTGLVRGHSVGLSTRVGLRLRLWWAGRG